METCLRPMRLRSNVVPSTRPTSLVCPPIADVLWCGRIAQRRSAGSPAVWLELTRRPGWERRRAALVAAAVWPGLSPAVDPRLGRGPRLCHVSTGEAARLAVDLGQAGAGFRTGLRRWLRAARTDIAAGYGTRIELCELSRLPSRLARAATVGFTRGPRELRIPRLHWRSLGHYLARSLA